MEAGSVADTSIEPGQEVDFDFSLEGSKTLIYFPVRGEPCLVDINRLSLLERDYEPYVPARLRGPVGTRILRRAYVGTGGMEYFMLIYVEQGSKCRLPVNEFITSVLDKLGNGFGRPWVGPMLVEPDVMEVLSPDRVVPKACEIVRYIQLFHAFLQNPGSNADCSGMVWAQDQVRAAIKREM
ncbi:hypothetical protein VNI00_011118 [Paramarasmius palmivorus]|uniref:Uncharacterized protein n=1 Tax=Paramarasmius palmivorus TaxID=297713 RepID=A0AAW0CEA1_9AGAR